MPKQPYTVTISFINRETKTFWSYDISAAIAIKRYYAPGRLLHKDVVVLNVITNFQTSSYGVA
jgi:hypothetical protein